MKCPTCDTALRMDDTEQWYCGGCCATWDEDRIVAFATKLLTESPRLSKEEYEAKRKLTLFIDLSWSYCGACDGGAFPAEPGHLTMAGYNAKPGQRGCGTQWKYVSSNYSDFDGLYDRIRQMRPDLEFWR